MKKQWTLTLIKYSLTLAIGAALSTIIWSLNSGRIETTVDRYRVLADAFTVPGILLLAVGTLAFISSKGSFDGLSYAISWLFARLIPGKARKRETYYDYVTRKSEKRARGYGFLFICGALFVAVAVVFTVLFYTVYTA